MHRAAATTGLLLTAVLLASCGTAADPGSRPHEAGDVPATPRALAAVAISHIDANVNLVNGRWSAYGEPLTLYVGLEYGANPESNESGPSYSVDVTVSDIAASTENDRKFFRCRAYAERRCESEEVDGGTLLLAWSPGGEEDPATYTWRLVREREVVMVRYDTSEVIDADPRTLDLELDPDDLRAAVLDPAMSLTTSNDAIRAGRALKRYTGAEKAPNKPVSVPFSAATFRKLVITGLGRHPTSTRPSTLTEFGPASHALHLEFPATPASDPITADVFSGIGRTKLLDPPPCGVNEYHERVQAHCYGRDRNNFQFWEPAENGRPGVVWIVSVWFNDVLNRPESAAVRLESTGLTQDFFIKDRGKVRFPRSLMERARRMVGGLQPAQTRVG